MNVKSCRIKANNYDAANPQFSKEDTEIELFVDFSENEQDIVGALIARLTHQVKAITKLKKVEKDG